MNTLMNILFLIKSALQAGFANVENFLIPAVAYAVIATLGALLLGWGRIFYQQVGNTLVLKLPGGGNLTAVPLFTALLYGYFFTTHGRINQQMMVVGHFLTFAIVLALVLMVLTHMLALLGSLIAYSRGLNFSIECMDGRCSHGSRSGVFMHYWACGGFTLLSAFGFAPLVVIPVLFGLPGGILGWIVLGVCLFPYPFVIGKLLAPRFSDGVQRLIKGMVDLLMLVEVPGVLLGSVTTSIVSFRLMPPGITRTKLH